MGSGGLKRGTCRRCALLSVIAVAVYVLAIQLVVPTDYYLNDDFTIASILNGSMTGVPEIHSVFNVVPFSVPLVGLYQMAPDVPWYYVALQLVTALALAVFCYASMLVAYAGCKNVLPSPAKRIVIVGLLVVAVGVLGWFPLVHADFTLAGALLVGAGCCLAVLCIVLPPIGLSKYQRIVHVVAGGVLVGVAYCVREKAGLVGLAFMAVIMCVGFLRDRRLTAESRLSSHIGMALLPACVAAALVFTSMGLQGIAYGSDEWKAFLHFGDVRSAYNDYGHKGYKGNEGLFAEYGWDENLYNLSLSWFLMDDRMTAEAFDAFTEHMTISTPVNVPAAFMSDSSAFVRYSLVALICLNFALCCVTCVHCGIRARESLVCIALLILMLGLLGYLAVSGRLVYRAAICALLPSTMVSWLSGWHAMCQGLKEPMESRAKAGRGGLVALVAAPVAMAAVGLLAARGFFGGHYNPPLLIAGLIATALAIASGIPGLRTRRMSICLMSVALSLLLVGAAAFVDSVKVRHANAPNDAAAAVMYGYAEEHPDDVFIYVAGICSTQPDVKQPTNTRCWGGWTCKAPFFGAYADEMLGFPSGLNAYSLMQDNVYFVTRSGEPKLLREYLTIHEGRPVDFKLVSQLERGLEVYSFERA